MLQVADIAAYDDAVRQKLIQSMRRSDSSATFAKEDIKHMPCVPLPP